MGDHQPPHKYIKNSSRYRITTTEKTLGDQRRPQVSEGQAKLPGMRWREDGDIKMERGRNSGWKLVP